MRNFYKALSQLGKRDGVSVNVIHFGATETLGCLALRSPAAIALTM